MNDYYELLTPLLNVIYEYVNDPTENIKRVYVTGHSLGAAMAERYMQLHDGSLYQAVTFSDPGYQSTDAALSDGRLTNIYTAGDPALQAPFKAFWIDKLLLDIGGSYQELGDIYVVINSGGDTSDGDLHDARLYAQESSLITQDYQAELNSLGFATNGKNDTISLFAKTTYSHSDGWAVCLPSGTIDGGASGTEVIRTGELAGFTSTVVSHGANDIVTFGLGHDTFVYNNFVFGDPLLVGGADVIANFNPDLDTVKISYASISQAHIVTFDDLAALMRETSDGVVIDFGSGHTLTLENQTQPVTIQLLANHHSDFLLT